MVAKPQAFQLDGAESFQATESKRRDELAAINKSALRFPRPPKGVYARPIFIEQSTLRPPEILALVATSLQPTSPHSFPPLSPSFSTRSAGSLEVEETPQHRMTLRVKWRPSNTSSTPFSLPIADPQPVPPLVYRISHLVPGPDAAMILSGSAVRVKGWLDYAHRKAVMASWGSTHGAEHAALQSPPGEFGRRSPRRRLSQDAKVGVTWKVNSSRAKGPPPRGGHHFGVLVGVVLSGMTSPACRPDLPRWH